MMSTCRHWQLSMGTYIYISSEPLCGICQAIRTHQCWVKTNPTDFEYMHSVVKVRTFRHIWLHGLGRKYAQYAIHCNNYAHATRLVARLVRWLWSIIQSPHRCPYTTDTTTRNAGKYIEFNMNWCNKKIAQQNRMHLLWAIAQIPRGDSYQYNIDVYISARWKHVLFCYCLRGYCMNGRCHETATISLGLFGPEFDGISTKSLITWDHMQQDVPTPDHAELCYIFWMIYLALNPILVEKLIPIIISSGSTLYIYFQFLSSSSAVFILQHVHILSIHFDWTVGSMNKFLKKNGIWNRETASSPICID